MSKFNDAYERLHEYWSYGSAIDYTVEEQLDDWVTIHREYTKLSKALDKACQKLWIAEGMMFKEHSNTKEQWREWLLNEDE